MVETPTSQTCGRGPSCGTRIWNRPSWRSAGSASPSCASVCRTSMKSPRHSTEMLAIGEIDADERLVASVTFDLDEIDAAFAELDARYIAGEAAAHAHTWSVIARTTAAFNRHEILATDWQTIDHRTLAPIDASDLPAAMRATWDLTPDFSTHIEAVHRLSGFGAVVTYTAYGTSLEGFAAEWRMVLPSRCQRRSNQPRRIFRRGRPGRRARHV